MVDTRTPRHCSDRLTSRRGAWIALACAVAVLAALFGLIRPADTDAAAGQAPVDSESQQVSRLLEQFPDADRQPVLVVATRQDGGALSQADLDALGSLRAVEDLQEGDRPVEPTVSEDGEAAVLVAPITVGEDNTATAEVIKELRADLATETPDGLSLEVTGGPADGLAGRVTAAAGAAWGFDFDAGIVSVLVFGAGTNYALLLVSRYREELERTDDDRAALSAAWRHTVPAILASNVTVVLALLTLLFASIPMTRGLGVPAALGLLIALVAVLFVLPPALAVFGRRLFWPFVPRPGANRRSGGVWQRVASQVVARPVAAVLAGLALLGVMATGLIGTSVGLDQLGKFRVASESASGLRTLSAHFAPGEAQPIWVVANSAHADDVVAAVQDTDGIVRAHPVGATEDEALTKIMVTSEHSPGTDPSLAQIGTLRDVVHAVDGADAKVGGQVATELDARAGNEHDLAVVAPLVLAVSFVVLLVLVRSLVAPVLLLVMNLASAVAAIGAGAWLSRTVMGQPALDLQVPILAFLFLVALGIDYTIFLVHRARHEAAASGTRQGMVEAVAHTGSVITSAGIVLAAVFAALGVLPLVTLGQLGLIVGLGVLVDTLVVRTVIVPALFALVGDRIWWPRRVEAAEPRHAA